MEAALAQLPDALQRRILALSLPAQSSLPPAAAPDRSLITLGSACERAAPAPPHALSKAAHDKGPAAAPGPSGIDTVHRHASPHAGPHAEYGSLAFAGLTSSGLTVLEGFLSPREVQGCLRDLSSALSEKHWQAGMGGSTATGSGIGGAGGGDGSGLGGGSSDGGSSVPTGRWRDPSVRGDSMRWLHSDEEARAGRRELHGLLLKMAALRPQLRAMGYDVGGRCTFQGACYPGGGSRYVRHTDASDSAPDRTVTAICYLNHDWDAQLHGGQLTVYNTHACSVSRMDGSWGQADLRPSGEIRDDQGRSGQAQEDVDRSWQPQAAPGGSRQALEGPPGRTGQTPKGSARSDQLQAAPVSSGLPSQDQPSTSAVASLAILQLPLPIAGPLGQPPFGLPDDALRALQLPHDPAPQPLDKPPACLPDLGTFVSPLGGRLVIFDSKIPHEVMPAYQSRYAVTTWFYRAAGSSGPGPLPEAHRLRLGDAGFESPVFASQAREAVAQHGAAGQPAGMTGSICGKEYATAEPSLLQGPDADGGSNAESVADAALVPPGSRSSGQPIRALDEITAGEEGQKEESRTHAGKAASREEVPSVLPGRPVGIFEGTADEAAGLASGPVACHGQGLTGVLGDGAAEERPGDGDTGQPSTIFVSIASYRDPETRWTVWDLFKKARRPDLIRVGIVWQVSNAGGHQFEVAPREQYTFWGVGAHYCFVGQSSGLFGCSQLDDKNMHQKDVKDARYQVDAMEDAEIMSHVGQGSGRPAPWVRQVREVRIPWQEAEGPCWARHLAQQLYRQEQYVLQIDSHMRFVEGWDELCLHQLQQAELADLAASGSGSRSGSGAGCAKVVLSTYPQDYNGEGAAAALPPDSDRVVAHLCADSFDGDGLLRVVARSLVHVPASPSPCPFWAAGFSFSRAQLIHEARQGARGMAGGSSGGLKGQAVGLWGEQEGGYWGLRGGGAPPGDSWILGGRGLRELWGSSTRTPLRCTCLAQVPYPPALLLPHLFFGEEVWMLARMWTRGWSVYSPSAPVVFHQWHRSSRGHTFQKDGALDLTVRRISQRKVLAVLGAEAWPAPSAEEGGNGGREALPPEAWRPGGVWGLGLAASLEAFERHVGVDFKSKQITGRARWGGLPEGLFVLGGAAGV